MNEILKHKEEMSKRIQMLTEEFNLSYINNFKSKKQYYKLSDLLYRKPDNLEIKNRFKVARKIKKQNEKKYYQMLHKVDLFYKKNRQLVFAFESGSYYVKYSFFTNELFAENNLSDEILVNLDYHKDSLVIIDKMISENNLNTIEKIKIFFNKRINKLKR